MRKGLLIWILALLLMVTLWGCAAKSAGAASADTATTEMAVEVPAAEPQATMAMDEADISYTGGGENGSSFSQNYGGHKVISTYEMELRTDAFDSHYEALVSKAKAMGGYVQYGNVWGTKPEVYGDSGRSAELTFRIPAEQAEAFLTFAEGNGEVVRQSVNTEDVTLDYYDRETRLEVLRTQLDRLQSILVETDNLADIIELEQAISFFPQYLPPGQQAQVALQPDDYAKKDIASIFSSEHLQLTQSILYDVGIAYIRLQSLSEFLLLLFRIEEDGAIMPVGIQYCFFRTWDVSFVNYCGIPFLIQTYDDAYGTGLLVVRTDWYNLQANQLQICYRSTLISGDQAWSPLGWTQFRGELSEPTIQEDDLGFTIAMEATSRLFREISDPLFPGTEYDWTRADPIQIRYDARGNIAYFLEGNGSWVDQSASSSYSSVLPTRLFLKPLREAAESQDPGSLWAQWALSNFGDWEQLLANNGIEYVEPED